MYFDSTVKIPVEKGKIIKKKKGNAIYVLYQYGQVYNAEKKYAVPQRTIIGRLIKTLQIPCTLMKHFQEFFPTVALLEELPETCRSCALKIGSYAVIQKVLEEYKIPQMLLKHFHKDSGLLLDLVSYMIVDTPYIETVWGCGYKWGN